MSTVYQCCKRTGDVSGILKVVHEAETQTEAVEWLERNGGGIYKNLLHKFQLYIAAK